MGEVFAGRYELIDPIGRGGVGAVWRAWDHRRRRYVAAKVLQQSDAHTLLRFVREQALRIEHPHVLAPASWAADDDKVLFTMDLVSGGSLAHVIGDYGPLPPRFVCLLLDQLLSGLSTVHAEGVVHRDIKPANILMEATGTGRPHLRLSDFGISMRKGEPRLTETNYVVGTPGYFAPEQMMGAEPDFPADLFAVGLVALYLLQGQKPDSQALVEHFAAHGTPGAPEGIPEPLWQVLAGLLQPDPQARFRTATGARKALTAAVEMLPEPGPDDEPVEVFDQIGPLPAGFGPDGPVKAPTSPASPASPAPLSPPEPQQPSQTPQPPVQEPPVPPPPVSMSETGSFHLAPPPQQQPPQPQPQFHQPAQPAAPSPYAVGAPDLSQAPTSGVPHDASATRPYTAQQHQQQHAFSAHAPAHAPAPVPVRQTRPGPPPKVAVPVLVVALICFAVGIWALTQM
ncbi:protein kinase [Streptomyces sp. SID8374]|uniref:serine/threonine-protein kinase n=1 Tax=unclassified Streptomyces TaxID=2593676 RepID=UPI00081D9DD2|nr:MULTISPECIES: serine/threonine-protein kinase [unclassified Streptomyces]MYR93044.1 protein kinase [Streptomyces sp. SID4937]MYX15023.1 protein kinase [Streptomyces sp. SID8374]SCD45484.1 Serine/threonine protein kinase [Streptomyces sp. ScaeMP-e83]